MIQIRSIGADELDAFASLGGHGRALTPALARLWEQDESRPEWCFVAEDEGQPIARLVLASVPPPEALREFRVVAPWLGPWDDAGRDAFRLLLDEAIERAVPPDALGVDFRLHAESYDRRGAFWRPLEAAGFRLLIEKQGFLWTDEGAPLEPPRRLVVRTLEEVGREAYGAVMARAAVDSLDREGRYYLAISGLDGWAREMFGYLEPGDEASWLLAEERASREPVGYVAIGPFDEPGTATIVYIGVVPEWRGEGFVDELLRAGMLAARWRGFQRILSDADVDNGPMLAALRRAGHDPSARPWHVWHYRREIAGPGW